MTNGDVLERYRAMLETPSVLAVDPSALLRDMAAEIERLRFPPLRAREEIAQCIWNGFGRMGGDFDNAKGTVAYEHCCGVADDILALSRTAGQEWRDISSAPRDGRDIWLWKAEWGKAAVGGWIDKSCMHNGRDVWMIYGGHVVEPTHWQSYNRPAPPVADKRDEAMNAKEFIFVVASIVFLGFIKTQLWLMFQ
jgi:hypothetical protein